MTWGRLVQFGCHAEVLKLRQLRSPEEKHDMASQAEVLSLDDFKKIVLEQTGLTVPEGCFELKTYSAKMRENKIIPIAQLLWIGGGNMPNRCSICHIPQFEIRLDPQQPHKCAFERCTVFDVCLRYIERGTHFILTL